ncbi:MAG: PD40 domain-containing protein [Clostridia bacterium]|nr:PD40 domain-containing protein [Clostridia bacterium]
MHIYRISETEQSTLIGMNGGLIESPDGKRIIYARKKVLEGIGHTELWVCDHDLKNHRLIYTGKCGNHNGPSASWIDNSVVVFRDMSGDRSAIIIMDVDSGRVMHRIYAKEGHRAERGIYPFSISEEIPGLNPEHPEISKPGIYTLDVSSNEIKMIVSRNAFLEMIRSHGLTPTSENVSVSHVQLNPSATSVMMRIGVPECPVFGALGCVDIANGKTHMIKDKPVHQLWYDDESYMATRQFANGRQIEMETSYIARFSKDGEELEVLGGIGNHIDGNRDRTMFSGDRCYPGYTPDIYVYERGNKKPFITIPMSDLQKVIWEHQVHPNPSFSLDGKRLYFNRPVSETKTEASFIEI